MTPASPVLVRPTAVQSREPMSMMLRGGLLASMVGAPVVVLACWVAEAERGALGAIASAAVVIGFFVLGQCGMRYVLEHMPPAVAMAGALAVYLFQLTVLALAILVLSRIESLDAHSVAVTALVVGLAWLIGQVWGFSRSRMLAFDVELPRVESS